MKKRIFLSIFAVAAAFASCNKQDLPYDLEGVEHGVVIDIKKGEGSKTLSTDMSSSDYSVVLSIPPQQGDYSMLKEAQVMAVYTDGQGQKKSAYAVEGITTFPYTAKINISEVCSRLGVAEIMIGDRIEFTPCTTLKSGTQVDGWSALTGFNNTMFSGWLMEDGTTVSYRQSYTAFAPFHKEDFLGTGILDDGDDTPVTVTEISEMPEAQWIPAGVTEDDLVGLRLEGDIWYGGDVIKMWINTLDFTLIIPDQVIRPNFTFGSYGTYDGAMEDGEGEIDTLNHTITFYLYSVWGPYSFGKGTMTVSFS